MGTVGYGKDMNKNEWVWEDMNKNGWVWEGHE